MAAKKAKKAKKGQEPLTFPVTVRINAYGFIGVGRGLLEDFGWKKDTAPKIDKNPDGSVTVRKA